MFWCTTILGACVVVLVLAVLFLYARCGMYVEGLKQWKVAEVAAEKRYDNLKAGYEQVAETLVREQARRIEDGNQYLTDLTAARKDRCLAETEYTKLSEAIGSRYIEAVDSRGKAVWWQELIRICMEYPQNDFFPENATIASCTGRVARIVVQLENQVRLLEEGKEDLMQKQADLALAINTRARELDTWAGELGRVLDRLRL